MGSHVVLELLKSGRPVVACRQPSSDISKIKRLFEFYNEAALFEKIRWAEVDVRDILSIEEALQGIENVYHCAGFVSFESKDRETMFSVNEGGTRNVVNACLHMNIKALCHVSSVAVINNSDHAGILTEKTFWKRSGRESHYAVSKYNAEREVWRGMEEGLNAVIVNPAVILSPVFWTQSSARIFDTCYNGNLFYTNGIASYVSAQDVAVIMIRLVDEGHFSQRYILSEGSYSFKTILGEVQTNFKKRPPAIRVSRTVLKLGWIYESLLSRLLRRPPRLTRAIVNSLFNKNRFSNEKVKTTLDFDFKPSFEVIRSICSFYVFEKTKHGSSV